MGKFKVGDRVKREPFGTGIVKAIDVAETCYYFVEFDKPSEGLHGGGYKGIYGKDSSCYWLADGDLISVSGRFKGNK